MTGVAEWLLALLFTLGPNGYLIDGQLATPQVQRGLPVSWVGSFSARVWVVFHSWDAAPMALYVPAEGLSQVSLWSLTAASGLPRLLPGMAAPRLFLFAPYYRSETGMVAIERMPVDVSEHYFHALLEAYLDLEVEHASGIYGAAVAERAAVVMTDVPPRHRREAYLSAVAEFGSHILSLANEVERSEKRQRAAGKDLCALVDHPATLFGLWRRSFHESPYSGGYFLSPEPGSETAAASRWVRSRRFLESRDKELFLQHVLAGFWSGEARSDFEHLCTSAGRLPD